MHFSAIPCGREAARIFGFLKQTAARRLEAELQMIQAVKPLPLLTPCNY